MYVGNDGSGSFLVTHSSFIWTIDDILFDGTSFIYFSSSSGYYLSYYLNPITLPDWLFSNSAIYPWKDVIAQTNSNRLLMNSYSILISNGSSSRVTF